MLKKVILIAASLALLVSLAGCACTATAAPTPTPTLEATQAVTPMLEMTPDMMEQTPDMAATPGGATGEAGTGATPGAGGTGNAAIENFKEGTEVKKEDVPDIVRAIETKYENVTIQTIKYATYEGNQVYEVELKSGNTTKTVYVQPDGTVTEKKA